MPRPYLAYQDFQLLPLLAQGDKNAFTEIYERYWDKLFYIAGKKVIDLGEADSLVQEVFLDLWHRRESLAIHTSLEHYLAVAMKYRVLKLLARQQKEAAYRFHQPAEPAASHNPETALQFEELKEKLEKLVHNLPQQCRIAYQLRDEGLSQKEIAAHMNISEHTVERHLSRALKSIRANISRFFCW